MHSPRANFLVDSAVVSITEKLLSGAGGWQAMKTARDIMKAGRASGATYKASLLSGEVREGQKTYRAGLRIREIPVRWNHAEGSKVSFFRDSLRMLREVIAIRAPL